jgi:hypothetical protein
MLNQFPPPYPGELLYSTICRYHKQSGNFSSKHTITDLFDNNAIGNIVFLPTNISQLYSKIRKPSYSIEEMIYNHTLFPYYVCFLHRFQREHLENCIKGSEQAAFHFSRCLIEKLKLCPFCIEVDYEQVGEPFWHVEHQVPAVLWCEHHSCMLIDKCPNCKKGFHANRNNLIQCEKTCKFCGYNFVNSKQTNPMNSDKLKALSICCDTRYILDNWHVLRDVIPNNWAVIYRKRLQELNYGDTFQKVPWDVLDQELRQLCGHNYYEFVIRGMKQTWIRDLYWSETRTHEPIKHILFIKFLYGSFHEFIKKEVTPLIRTKKIA